MFKWDGSEVTDIINKSDIYEFNHNKLKYWIIKYLNFSETCIIKSCKNTIPCMIDELKTVFGLQKLGTQWFTHDNRKKLLIKCIKNKNDDIVEEIRLKQVKKISKLLTLQVQEIYTFRELLGITMSFDSSIIYRKNKYGGYPISFVESNMKSEDKKNIPNTVLNKWFGEVTIDSVVMRIFKIYDINQLNKTLFMARNQMEKIINRVEKNNISYLSYIMNRITQRLQSTLVMDEKMLKNNKIQK